MKTTTKIISAVMLCLGLSTISMAQCNAGFTYTVGTAGQVNFTDASTGTTGGTVYYWNFGDNTYSQVHSPSHTFPYNGTYHVTLQIDSAINGCNSIITNTIVISNTINCNVQAVFTYTVGSNGQVSFTDASTNVISGMNYYWNFGNNVSSSATSPVTSYPYNGNYVVQLRVSDNLGFCSSTYTASVAVTTTLTAPACTAAFTYTTGASGLVSFTSLYTGNSSNLNYSWDFGNGNYSTAKNPVYTYPYNGNYNVTLTVHDSLNNSCSATTSNTVAITNTVNQPCLPTVSFSIHPDSLNVGSGIWNINPNYSSQVSSAVWHWGDGSSTAGLYPSHTYTNAGWYNICVTVYALCGDSSTTCQNDSVYRMAYSTTANMVHVNVINHASGIKANTNTMTLLKVYPNPFNEDLTISFTSYENKKLTYVMYDMMGNQVIKESVDVVKGDNEFKINTNGIGHGVYFINMTGSDGKKTSTLKVVK
ncbi:MAG TPA: PKD domain-containing protein [Bacteroidia bacterium]|jgi:PKD repeat protein|nr:PKD domain-containing protein [Bacteroidia bacterium]